MKSPKHEVDLLRIAATDLERAAEMVGRVAGATTAMEHFAIENMIRNLQTLVLHTMFDLDSDRVE